MAPSRTTPSPSRRIDRKSTRLNSSHTEIYTLSLHDALPIFVSGSAGQGFQDTPVTGLDGLGNGTFKNYTFTFSTHRSEEHTSELQSHRDLHSFPTRRSSDLREWFRRPRLPGHAGDGPGRAWQWHLQELHLHLLDA